MSVRFATAERVFSLFATDTIHTAEYRCAAYSGKKGMWFWSSVHGLVPLHQHCTTSHRNRVDYIHELQEDCGKLLLEANVSGETLPFTSPALVISLAAELTALFQLLELGHAEAKQLICPVIEK